MEANLLGHLLEFDLFFNTISITIGFELMISSVGFVTFVVRGFSIERASGFETGDGDKDFSSDVLLFLSNFSDSSFFSIIASTNL